jgi:predicted ATPase
LHRCDAKLNGPVNRWLSHNDFFDSGYSLASVVRKTYVEVKSGNKHDLNRMKEQLNSAIKSEKSDNFFDDVIFTEGAVLYDIKKNITLAPNQVGSGISQIIPVITAAHQVTDGLVAVEQPELHIHPAFQVEIGDLFTQLEVDPSRRPTFLIETHSEHLMLRLLRRIRETSDNELKSDMKPVKPSDIAIIYLEAPDNEVVVRRIEIDEDGEFKQRWPKGFFSERRRELM